MLLVKSFTHKIVWFVSVGFLWGAFFSAQAQVPKLASDAHAMANAKGAITCIYHWKFDSAQWYIDQIKQTHQAHPVYSFLEGMRYFWQNIPTALDSPAYQEHIRLMIETQKVCETMLESNEDNWEAIFFNLTSTGILMRYYSAAGQKLKAVGEARSVYKFTKRAKELKEEFVEFYFMVGIYNYFREAYPEKYPIYKPFAWLFESGDKAKGIEQLQYVVNHGVFSVPEALNYLSIIYGKYERNPEQAIVYMQRLAKQYPENLWFRANYIRLLVKLEFYEDAQKELNEFEKVCTPGFYQTIALFLKGQLAELHIQNYSKAYEYYSIAEQALKPYEGLLYTEEYWEQIYEGLMRYYQYKKDREKAQFYKEKAKSVGQ